jgi:hypothetical protein
MNWLWINLPLAAAFFIAMTAIPLWLSFRRTDTGPNAVVPAQPTARPAAVPRAAVVAHSSAEQAWLARVSDSRVRELAGAWQ